MPSSLSLCLKQKEAQVRSCFPSKKKNPLFFGIPISNITRKFYGKGEQFGDETLGRKQIDT